MGTGYIGERHWAGKAETGYLVAKPSLDRLQHPLFRSGSIIWFLAWPRRLLFSNRWRKYFQIRFPGRTFHPEKDLSGPRYFFQNKGPKCSGPEIRQYSESSMSSRFAVSFERIKCREEKPIPLANAAQRFCFAVSARFINPLATSEDEFRAGSLSGCQSGLFFVNLCLFRYKGAGRTTNGPRYGVTRYGVSHTVGAKPLFSIKVNRRSLFLYSPEAHHVHKENGTWKSWL